MQPKNQQIKFQKKKRSLKKKSRDLFLESQVVLVIKNLPANAGDIRDVGLIPRSGRSPGGGQGNPLPIFLPGESMERGAWRAIIHAVSKSQT